MTPEILANLRNILAVLYSDDLSIQRVIADAGILPARIKFNAAAIDVWHLVLTEATKLNQVEILLTVVEREYSSNLELQSACLRYRQVASKHHLVPDSPELLAEQKSQSDLSHSSAQTRLYPPIINHDAAIHQFRQLLLPNAQMRFMRLLGDGEMGKTTLMTKIFPVLATQYNVRTAYIDMRNQAQKPTDFLHAICSQIDRHGFPIFDKAYEQWLNRPKVQMAGFSAIFSKIQVSSGSEREDREDLTLYLSRKFVDDLDNAATRQVLLLFDTVDNASSATQTWLMDKLLVQLQSLPHVRVVVSGRALPDASGGYALNCCSHELRPVDDPSAYVRYCRELGVTLTEQQIHDGAKFCHFNPGRFANAIKVHFAPASTIHG